MATELRDFPAEAAGGATGMLAGLRDRIRVWEARQRERRHMAEFSETMCRDIGVHRGDVLRAARKPFDRSA